jgi:hypothetical protein
MSQKILPSSTYPICLMSADGGHPPRTLAAIIDGTGPPDVTVTALAQAVPYRCPASRASGRNPSGGGR